MESLARWRRNEPVVTKVFFVSVVNEDTPAHIPKDCKLRVDYSDVSGDISVS